MNLPKIFYVLAISLWMTAAQAADPSLTPDALASSLTVRPASGKLCTRCLHLLVEPGQLGRQILRPLIAALAVSGARNVFLLYR